MIYRRRHTTCLFEILMSVLLIDLGLRFLFNPNTIASSNMRELAHTINPELLGLFCFAVGFCRGAILGFEKFFVPWGIKIRLGLTIASGILWTIMVTGFFETFYRSHTALPPGFDMMFIQSIGELVVALQLSREQV